MSDKLTSLLTPTPLPRRTFLRAASATAATSALLLAGCGDDDNSTPPTPATPTLTYSTTPNISANAVVFNYLYSLHQLTLDFYQQVVTAFPTDMPAVEQEGFTDLRDHELIYTEAYKFILGSNAIPALMFSFTTLTLTTRTGVLAAAKQLEGLTVAAYNDAVARFTLDATGVDYLLFAGKIASVQARHAAYVRNLETPGSFAGADVIVGSGDLAGLDATLTPSAVVTALAPYFTVAVSTNTAALA